MSKKKFVDELAKVANSYVLLDESTQIKLKNVSDSIMIKRFSRLTPRELEVLSGLISGERSKAISLRLNVSCRTVELHRAHIMDKLEIDSLAQLIKILLLCDSEENFAIYKSYFQLNKNISI